MPKQTLPRERASADPGGHDRLESWKEIALYLKRDIRTLHRWERFEGLPVHRHAHTKAATVYAYRSELEAWRTSRAPRRRTAAARVMLAVLPFTPLGGGPDDEYFGDGLTEEVLAQLGRLNPACLGVIARTSVMRYKRTLKPIDRIGQELGVAYVLEGSVRRGGETVRITAQLIRVRDQSHLWAESYDRDLTDVLLVQGEIARAIAREIHVAVTAEGTSRLARARRVNSEAHEACLKGRYHWYKLSREHLDVALEYFHLALQKDPDYAPAHAGVAYVWFSRGDCGLMPPRIAFPEAKAAALRALALDDALTEVHELLGNIRRHFDWDWPGAERAFTHAIGLDPNYADAHFMYSDFLISVGRPREAEAEMQRALELDPLNFLFQCFRGWHLNYLRRYDEAIAQLYDTLRTEPSYPAAHLGLWGAFYRKRLYEEARAAARTFFGLLGDDELVATLGAGGGEKGYREAMGAAAAVLERRRAQAHVPAVRIARLFAHAGDDARALDWLEEARDHREPPLVHLAVAWDWDGIRTHPRFERLLHGMGLNGSAPPHPDRHPRRDDL